MTEYLRLLISQDLKKGLRLRYKKAMDFPLVCPDIDKGEVALVWSADRKHQVVVVSIRGVTATYEIVNRIERLMLSAYKGNVSAMFRPFEQPHNPAFDRDGALGLTLRAV